MLLIMIKHWESWIAFNWGRGGQFILLGAAFYQPDQLQCNGLPYIDFKNSSENLTTLTTPNLYITNFIGVWETSSKWTYISLQQWLKLCGNNILKGLLLNIYTSHAGKTPCMPYTGQVADPTFFSLTGTGTDFSVYLIWFVLARGCRFSYGCGTLQPFTYLIFWAKQNKNEKIIQAQQVSYL